MDALFKQLCQARSHGSRDNFYGFSDKSQDAQMIASEQSRNVMLIPIQQIAYLRRSPCSGINRLIKFHVLALKSRCTLATAKFIEGQRFAVG